MSMVCEMFDLNLVDSRIFRKLEASSMIWIDSYHDQETKW